MKRSKQRRAPGGIQRRILVYLISFVGLILLLLWLFQVVLLDSFYRAYNMRIISATAEVLLQNLDNENLDVLAERLAVENDLCVLIYDESGEALITAEGQRRCLIHRMGSAELEWWRTRAAESETPVTEIFEMQSFRTDRYNASGFRGEVPRMSPDDDLNCLYVTSCTMADGTAATMMLNLMITPVNATVSALRNQLISITVVVLVGAVLLALLISRRVSQPIIATNKAAKSLPRGEYTPPPHAHTYREISELNDTLSNAAEELKQVENLQHELIANISHDLRTPLTMIEGYAEVMRDIPSEATPENVQIIIDETNRLSSLVNELLDFSRMQTGSVPLSMTAFCLTDSIRAHVDRIAQMVGKDGYIIRFEPEESVSCVADEKRIGQVIYNLIGNALTYTGEDRTVTITQRLKGDTVRIEIHDTGKGIAPDELELIWNRYYRTK